MTIDIQPITESDREWVRAFLWQQAGNTRMVTRGRLFQCDELPGFIGHVNGERAGVVTVHVNGRDCEIVTLHTAVPGRGLGSALLAAAADYARQHGCHRAWLITTNDNEPAIRFYQNRGWQLTAVHKNALSLSRQLKPEIPLLGLNDIPIEDEWEFELVLANGD